MVCLLVSLKVFFFCFFERQYLPHNSLVFFLYLMHGSKNLLIEN